MPSRDPPPAQPPWGAGQPLPEPLRPWRALPVSPVLPCLPTLALPAHACQGLGRGVGERSEGKLAGLEFLGLFMFARIRFLLLPYFPFKLSR